MRDINIFIEPHVELPDERALVEILVEQLNATMAPMALRIGRVEWDLEDDKTECRDVVHRVPTEDSIRFHLSGDEDTRLVQFVLQLQTALNGLYDGMVAVRYNELTVLGVPMLPLRNIPYVRNSPQYSKIMEKVQQAAGKDYGLSMLLDKFLRSEGEDSEEKTKESYRESAVRWEMKPLTRLASKLTDAALLVVRKSRPSSGPRWKQAEELFWQGDYQEALKVLELPKIKTELRKAVREGDLTTGENRIMEALLRLQLLQVDRPDRLMSVIKSLDQEIESIYRTCVTCGSKCLSKKDFAALLLDYASFLDETMMESRNLLNYERALPLCRELAEEDPENGLPELALALSNYALQLELSLGFGDLYNCTPDLEELWMEVLDIYRLLAVENPDAALPLWADASHRYGMLLFRMCYSNRAKQAFSEAMGIYQQFAKRMPLFYKPIMAKQKKSLKYMDFFCGYVILDEEISEEVQIIKSRAERDVPEAQYQLGERYFKGDGICKDYEEARKWYLRAAENGYAKAQQMLGHCYWNSTLGKRNPDEALRWYHAAAAQGDVQAQMDLAKISMSRNDQQGYDEAFYWLHEAVENAEDGEPYFLLGQFYENSPGEYKSYEKAAYWYRKGDDDFGNLKCLFQLGKLYHYGKGVPKDYDEALRCYVEVRTWGYISYREVQNQIDLLMKDWKETP